MVLDVLPYILEGVRIPFEIFFWWVWGTFSLPLGLSPIDFLEPCHTCHSLSKTSRGKEGSWLSFHTRLLWMRIVYDWPLFILFLPESNRRPRGWQSCALTIWASFTSSQIRGIWLSLRQGTPVWAWILRLHFLSHFIHTSRLYEWFSSILVDLYKCVSCMNESHSRRFVLKCISCFN